METRAPGCFSSTISRREFLKGAGLVIGGTTIATMTAISACKSKATSTPVPSSIDPTQSSSTVTTSFTKTTTTPNTQNTSANNVIYVTPSEAPPLLDFPGLTTKVATDRLYSYEHIWVMSISPGHVVLGVTDKLQSLLFSTLSVLGRIVPLPVDSILVSGSVLGTLESQKMNLELIAPVSGTVVQINDELDIRNISVDPYVKGWIMVTHLSKPDELQQLLKPESYASLILK